MCVTFVYLNADAIGDPDRYQLIILNNRDENFDRPTSFAAWEDDILAGRDEAIPNQKGGTWLGIRKDGKIGVLLSELQKGSTLKAGAPTRGKIVIDYLKSMHSADNYGTIMAERAKSFNGFNLLLFDRVKDDNGQNVYNLVTLGYTQATPVLEKLGSGLYGFGNSPRSLPFKKVEHGTKLFKEKIEQMLHEPEDVLLREFIQVLQDDTCHHPDDQLMSQTEQHEECSKAMSQLFYRYPHPHRYGTRSHTIILINGIGRVVYFEVSLMKPSQDFTDPKWAETKLIFNLEEVFAKERF